MVETYNNEMHWITKKNHFKEVSENTLNSSKNYMMDSIIFNKYNYVLIFNNFDSNYIKKRNITILRKIKN